MHYWYIKFLEVTCMSVARYIFQDPVRCKCSVSPILNSVNIKRLSCTKAGYSLEPCMQNWSCYQYTFLCMGNRWRTIWEQALQVETTLRTESPMLHWRGWLEVWFQPEHRSVALWGRPLHWWPGLCQSQGIPNSRRDRTLVWYLQVI